MFVYGGNFSGRLMHIKLIIDFHENDTNTFDAEKMGRPNIRPAVFQS